MIHPTALVDNPDNIGADTNIWHFSHVMPEAHLGESCTIGQNVFIGNHVQIGDHVKIQNNSSIFEGVVIEDYAFIGPSVTFTNVINPRSQINRKSEYKKTTIRHHASLGANVTVVCGVTIGAFAFIGAGTVVIRDVAPYELVVGNPGRRIGWMSEFGKRLKFDEQGIAICHASDETYVLSKGEVRKLNIIG